MSEIVNGCFTSSLKKNQKKKSIATWQEKEEIFKKCLMESGVGFDDEGGTSTP